MSETKRSEMMKIHGSCHCGQIIFEAQANPARAVLCHCTDCQMMSGSPYRSIVQVKEADFSLLAGEPKPYFKVGDSGNRRELSFCANCGSHLYATSVTEDVPKGQRTFGIRTGLLRELAQLPPQAQVWCQSKVAWADDISHLPGVDQQS
jgi:hypothetical protein